MILVVVDLLVAGVVVYGACRMPSPWWLVVAAFLLAELAADVREWRRR